MKWIALVILAALVLAPVASAGIAPLVYRDTGYELPPGYKVTVQIHAEAGRNPLFWAFAGVTVKIGQLEVGYDADPPGWAGLGTMNVYFYVKKNGEYLLHQEVDSLGFNAGTRAYEATLTFTLDCNGNLQVSTPYGVFTSSEQAGQPLDIFDQTGSSSGGTIQVSSMVTYGESEQIANCGNNGSGVDLPQPGNSTGSATVGGHNPQDDFMQKLFNKLLQMADVIKWGLAGLFIVVAIVFLARVRGGVSA